MITVKQLNKYTGRGGWKMPTESDYKFARGLVDKLASGAEAVKEFIKIMDLDYEVKLLAENKDIIVVFPKDRGQLVVLYNVDPSLRNIISCPHSGQDSVDSVGYDLMIEGVYKCMVINGYQPNSCDLPSPYQSGRKISNADHSPVPSMNDFLDQFINHTPSNEGCYLYVLHGMVSSKSFKYWAISSTGKRTTKNLKDNINFWLCVAWTYSKFKDLKGQTNYDFSEFYTLNKDGTKKFLTNDKDFCGCYFKQFRGPTTSVSSHIMNAGKITKKQGIDKGRVAHCEHSISTLGNRSYWVAMLNKEAFRLMSLAENKDMKEAPRDINELIKWLSLTS